MNMKKTIPLALAIAFLPLLSCSSSQKGSPDIITMFLGTYTEGSSRGLYAYRFDQNSGVVCPVEGEDPYSEAPYSYAMAEVENPSYLAVVPIGSQADAAQGKTPASGKMAIYCVSEKAEGSVHAFIFKALDGEFTSLGAQSTSGADPCHISVLGGTLACANYSGGTVDIFPIAGNDDPDAKPWSLKESVLSIKGGTGGPDSLRQNAPHMHCAYLSDGRLLCSDFSADRILCLDFDGKVPDTLSKRTFPLEKDFGPRHILTHDGKIYVIGELSGKVSVLSGSGEVIQSVTADSLSSRGSADIRISPDGKFLYASVRLANDGIAIFRILEGKGTLEWAGYERTGAHPRNIAITPNGKFLLASCRDSGVVQVFSRDEKTGLLTPTGSDIPLDRPVCIMFVR